jgi:predicted ArsR family transcriptional regulator
MAVPSQEQAQALAVPTRHEIFRYLAAAPGDVGVAELTDHLGLNHNAIRQHLAKLVASGLVEEHAERRTRPGRPRLLYRVAPAVAGPEPAGAYERLAVWLTEAVATGDGAAAVGRRAGGELADGDGGGAALEQLCEVMARQGFEPELRRTGRRTELVLHSCPYSSAVLADRDTVCELHRGLAEGAAEVIGGLTVDRLVAHDPHRAGCRLVVREQPA